MGRNRRLLAALLLGVLALTGAARLVREEAGRREVLLAVPADEADSFCRKSGLPLPDFWERARILGISAGVLSERSLSYFAGRGDLFYFSGEELGKWEALGLIAPGTAIKPETLGTRDPKLLTLVEAAAARQGLALSTFTASGYSWASTSGPLVLDASAGPDPRQAEALANAGLKALLPGQGGWRPRALRVTAPLGHWLEAASTHPRRLVILNLDMGKGVEENFEALRRGVRGLGAAGIALSTPADPQAPESPGPGRLRRLLAMALALLGPLAASRAGLGGLKSARAWVLAQRPLLSPVAQLAAGYCCAVASAAAAGLACRVLAISTEPPGFWSLAGPVLLGGAILYAEELGRAGRDFGAPVRYSHLLKAAAAACAAYFLATRSGPILGSADWWWLASRWREILLGLPGLLCGLFLVNWGFDCPGCAEQNRIFESRRLFLLAGILGLAGLQSLAASGELAAAIALRQIPACALVGGGLGGAALLLARGYSRS
ncbi:MAG: hypothetical protein HY921_09095 [Elusimicrobia bacterium]|nr:hypothetical protein [Elusimicrobiota bacterium]